MLTRADGGQCRAGSTSARGRSRACRGRASARARTCRTCGARCRTRSRPARRRSCACVARKGARRSSAWPRRWRRASRMCDLCRRSVPSPRTHARCTDKDCGMLLLLFSCSPHPLPPLGLVLVTVLVARRRRSLLVQLRRRLPRAHELVDLRGCDQQRAAARRDLPTFCKNAAARC
jgi:hypothetical protein